MRSANDRLKFTEAIVEPIDVRWHAHARIALTAGKGVDAVPETCSMRSALALAQAGSSPETRQWSERSGAGAFGVIAAARYTRANLTRGCVSRRYIGQFSPDH